MNDYEVKAYQEIEEWKSRILKNSSLMNRLSKKAQTKINTLIPEKAHHVITESIKNMVKTILIGSNFTLKKKQVISGTLLECDLKLEEKVTSYRKAAAIEGAGTGAAGFLLGLADFPLLLSIKIKFLFEAAEIYGYDTNQYEERLFVLHVFKLAFSSDEKRRETFELIENWEVNKKKVLDLDWREFQQEYRDYIDFVKLLQMIPGIGAVVGAYANYNLLDHLGEVTKNCYRIRKLNPPNPYM